MKLKTHICMVSGQPTPNLTPILDERTRPERVVMVVSSDMKNRALWLESVIKNQGVRVTKKKVKDPWDIEKLHGEFSKVADEFPEDVGLNVTGGTKPMAIVAHEVFRSKGFPIFYVHPEKDRLLWLYPELPPISLQNRVNIENFLLMHGGKVSLKSEGDRLSPDMKSVSGVLIDKIERFGSPLGPINYLAQTAEKRLQSDRIDKKYQKWRAFNELIELFEKNKLLERKDGRLFFSDEKSRFFVNGGWLEYYVEEVVQRLRRKLPIQSVARSIDVCHIEKCDVKNELDVAFLADNRLYIIECKTKRFVDRHGRSTADSTETIYKLDVLKDYGGIQAKGMLVSFRELPEPDRERADAMGIKTVVGEDLKRLEREIEKWVKQ